jgi:hypothetical protein
MLMKLMQGALHYKHIMILNDTHHLLMVHESSFTILICLYYRPQVALWVSDMICKFNLVKKNQIEINLATPEAGGISKPISGILKLEFFWMFDLI